MYPWWSQTLHNRPNCIGPAYWYWRLRVCITTHNWARWIWEYAPQGRFFKFDALRWLLGWFWALQPFFLSRHDNRILICFKSTHMGIGVHWHWQFQTNLENCVKGWHRKASQSFASHLVWILFQTTPAKNVAPTLKIQSSSNLCNSLLRLDHEVCVGTDVLRQ